MVQNSKNINTTDAKKMLAFSILQASALKLQKETALVDRQIRERVNSLAQVANNVMKKSVGPGWRTEENILDYFRGARLEWMPYCQRPQISTLKFEVTEKGVQFKSEQFSTNPNARALVIPNEILKMSERDFAGVVREAVKRRRAHEDAQAMISADMEIILNNEKIEELQQDNRRLANILKRGNPTAETVATAAWRAKVKPPRHMKNVT